MKGKGVVAGGVLLLGARGHGTYFDKDRKVWVPASNVPTVEGSNWLEYTYDKKAAHTMRDINPHRFLGYWTPPARMQ